MGFSKPSYDEPEGEEPTLGHWDITSQLETLVINNGALVKREVIVTILLDNRLGSGLLELPAIADTFSD